MKKIYQRSIVQFFYQHDQSNVAGLKKNHQFQAVIEIHDSKFKNYVSVIKDNSIDFDILIRTGVIRQGILTIFVNDVKINKFQNDYANPFINVINASQETVNS